MTPCAPGRENIVIRTERALEFRIWYDSGQSIVNENVLVGAHAHFEVEGPPVNSVERKIVERRIHNKYNYNINFSKEPFFNSLFAL